MSASVASSSVFTVHPEEPTHFEEAMPDLFSISIDDGSEDLGFISPSIMLTTGVQVDVPEVKSLKDGRGADRTLSAINARGGRVNLPNIPFSALQSTDASSSHDVNASSSSGAGTMGKENQTLKDLMGKKTVQARVVKREKPETERKRPGRKRLELPTDEEVMSISDPKIKKRLQNRKASRECRARKAEVLQDMERQVQTLQTENAELSYKYNEVVQEQAELRKQNHELQCRLDQFEQQFQKLHVSRLSEIAVC